MDESRGNILVEDTVYRVLTEMFPKRNDFAESDYSEELAELHHFGIKSEEDFRQLLVKHRAKILEIDASPMDNWHEEYYQREYPDQPVRERIDQGFWFAFPALLRLALELEFGEQYEKFANKRDEA